MKREPVLTAAMFTAVVVAAVNVIVILDIVAWDSDQLAAVNVLVTTLVALLFAVWARGRVTPVAAGDDE